MPAAAREGESASLDSTGEPCDQTKVNCSHDLKQIHESKQNPCRAEQWRLEITEMERTLLSWECGACL